MSSDKARWLHISGLELTNDDIDLLVCDSKLCTVRIVKKDGLLLGNYQDFQPFAIRIDIPNKEKFLSPILLLELFIFPPFLLITQHQLCAVPLRAQTCLILEIDSTSAKNVTVVTDCISVEDMTGDV